MTGVPVRKGERQTGERFVKSEMHTDTQKVEAETGAILPQTRSIWGYPGSWNRHGKKSGGLEREPGSDNSLVWGF